MKESDLGLSSESRKCLLDTNIIFHAAATVRFNESLRNAVNINVRGTKQLLLFAKEFPNLKVSRKRTTLIGFSFLLIQKFDYVNYAIVSFLFRHLSTYLLHILIA